MPVITGEKKQKRTVALDPSLWGRLDDLVGIYGNSTAEVLSYIVLNWFSTNQLQIREMKESAVKISDSIATKEQ
jgi:hypothetical protein